MRNLVIMPTENKERMNLGEFAEEATIIEETATPKRVNHFIEANTQEATLQHLKMTALLLFLQKTMSLQ